ncbi:hypothetical protein LL962_08140 [Xanthomonas sp. NCPPB 1067]|nr:hypothetical protein [Xanthomonas sp. NCPPB 1067]MCC4587070.1 hypothetical protein [Xanthomonas sp. NCPPB 1067]
MIANPWQARLYTKQRPYTLGLVHRHVTVNGKGVHSADTLPASLARRGETTADGPTTAYHLLNLALQMVEDTVGLPWFVALDMCECLAILIEMPSADSMRMSELMSAHSPRPAASPSASIAESHIYRLDGVEPPAR